MAVRNFLPVAAVLVFAFLLGMFLTPRRATAAQETPCLQVCNFNEVTTHNVTPDPCYGGSSFVTSNKAVGTCGAGCVLPCQYEINVTVNSRSGVNCTTLEIFRNFFSQTVCNNCSSLGWNSGNLQITCSAAGPNTDVYETQANGVTGAQHDVTCKKCQ